MANKQKNFNDKVGLTEDDSLILDDKAAESTAEFASSFERAWHEHLAIAQGSRDSDPMTGYENAPTVEVEDDE